MKNHLGQYECKLCLTLHMNEGNYLAHTQGKRHQYNLGRRAVSHHLLPLPEPLLNPVHTGRPKKLAIVRLYHNQ